MATNWMPSFLTSHRAAQINVKSIKTIYRDKNMPKQTLAIL